VHWAADQMFSACQAAAKYSSAAGELGEVCRSVLAARQPTRSQGPRPLAVSARPRRRLPAQPASS
jgi:hypothetical protein